MRGREAVGASCVFRGTGTDHHADVATGVAQAERLRATLVPVTDDADRRPREETPIGVGFPKNATSDYGASPSDAVFSRSSAIWISFMADGRSPLPV